MLNREQIVNLLNANKLGQLGHDGKFSAVRSYIKERKGEDFNPQQVDLGQLELSFNIAMEWFMGELNIFTLKDSTNRIIKFY